MHRRISRSVLPSALRRSLQTVSDKDRAEVQALLTEAKAALEQGNWILHATVGELMFGGKTAFSGEEGDPQRLGSSRVGRPLCMEWKSLTRLAHGFSMCRRTCADMFSCRLNRIRLAIALCAWLDIKRPSTCR